MKFPNYSAISLWSYYSVGYPTSNSDIDTYLPRYRAANEQKQKDAAYEKVRAERKCAAYKSYCCAYKVGAASIQLGNEDFTNGRCTKLAKAQCTQQWCDQLPINTPY